MLINIKYCYEIELSYVAIISVLVLLENIFFLLLFTHYNAQCERVEVNEHKYECECVHGFFPSLFLCVCRLNSVTKVMVYLIYLQLAFVDLSHCQ